MTETNSTDGGGCPSARHVEFNDTFFTHCENAYFRLAEDSEESVFPMPVNGLDYALHFDGIRQELDLSEDCVDSQMLDTVAGSQSCVQALRVGDQVPAELITDEPSWNAVDRHYKLACDRLFAQLVTWLGSEEEVIAEPDELERMMQDPESSRRSRTPSTTPSSNSASRAASARRWSR